MGRCAGLCRNRRHRPPDDRSRRRCGRGRKGKRRRYIRRPAAGGMASCTAGRAQDFLGRGRARHLGGTRGPARPSTAAVIARSEEHTSELQSLMRISYAVFCLKKKKTLKHNKDKTCK